MATLETTFAGLKLKNPIIISSSGLTDSAAKNQKLYEAGAGAIVLKSLFEEQIMMEADWLGDPNMYPEGSDYLVGYIREHKLGEYLNLIKETKKVCDIPVIASINCYQDADWIEFARKIEEAGADALEVNILALQTDIQYAYGSFEQRHIDILSHIRKTVNIPVIMKLGDNLTNPIALIDQLYANGAAAVVMFNRFYQPDIDIEKMAQSAGSVFSTDADLSKSLRWIGIASAAVSKLDYAASGGIHAPEGVVKAILAGASAVEICSALYQNSYAIIEEYVRFLSAWMERKGMENISQFKVRENIAFGLNIQKLPKAEVDRRIEDALARMQIGQYVDRYPSELSGGQQQRVAIARAIASEPHLLLMDEPLSNLDAKLRVDMRSELKRLHIETGTTMIYVTHDQVEALTMSTKIAIFKEGVIIQVAPPLELYNNPANLYVADFIGNPSINFADGKAEVGPDGLTVTSPLGKMVFPKKDLTDNLPKEKSFDAVLGIRPEQISINTTRQAPSDIEAHIYTSMPAGSETLVTVKVGGVSLVIKALGITHYNPDQVVYLSIDLNKINVFDKKSTKLIKYSV